jgi:hypothetical protein
MPIDKDYASAGQHDEFSSLVESIQRAAEALTAPEARESITAVLDAAKAVSAVLDAVKAVAVQDAVKAVAVQDAVKAVAIQDAVKAVTGSAEFRSAIQEVVAEEVARAVEQARGVAGRFEGGESAPTAD